MITETEIEKIIREAEENPNYWQEDNAEDLRFINQQIKKHGRIKIDEI
jgi:hypothetical protein